MTSFCSPRFTVHVIVPIKGAITVTIVFFFNDTATTEIYTLSLHDALPISPCPSFQSHRGSTASSVPCTTDRMRRTGVTSRSIALYGLDSVTAEAETFESLRPDLLSLAYRMLGEVGRAEERVQEAWIRWQNG